MVIGTDISIPTLNVNRLIASTKKHRLAEWIQKQDPYICCLQDTRLRPRDTYRLKVRGWKKIFHANGNQKKAGVAILISDKIDYKTKTITRDKEGHYFPRTHTVESECGPCWVILVVVFFLFHHFKYIMPLQIGRASCRERV